MYIIRCGEHNFVDVNNIHSVQVIFFMTINMKEEYIKYSCRAGLSSNYESEVTILKCMRMVNQCHIYAVCD